MNKQFDRTKHTYKEWLDYCSQHDICPDCEINVETKVLCCTRWHGKIDVIGVFQ